MERAMTNSRSTGSASKVLGLAVAVAIALGAGARTADAERRRVVILEFRGPGADKFHADVVKIVRKNHTVLGIEKWESAADEVSATKINSKNVKKVARKLNVDGVVVGEIEKRRDRFILRIKVREGRSGDYVGNPIEVTSGEQRLDARATRDLKAELLDTIETLEAAVSADDDEDDGGSARDRDRDSDRDRDRDRDADRDRDRDADRDRDRDAEDDEDEAPPRRGFSDKDDERRGRDQAKGRDQEEEDEDEEPPPRGRDRDRGDPRTSDGEDDENPLGAGKGKGKGKGKGTNGSSGSRNAQEVEMEEEDEDEDGDRVAARGDDEEDEEDEDGDRVAARGDDEEDEEDGDTEIRDRGEVDDGDVDYGSPALRSVDAVLGMSVTRRSLTYTAQASLQNPPDPYKGAPVAGIYLDADIYPLALANKRKMGVTRNLGITVLADRVIKINSQVGDEKIPTSNHRYGVGVIYRQPLGKLLLKARVRYSRLSFIIDKEAAMPGTVIDVPNVRYSVIDPGAGFVYALSPKLALGADLAVMLISKTGEIQEEDQYGGAKVLGIDAELHGDYRITSKIFARATFHLVTIGFTFDGEGALVNRDADPDPDVGGARDTYLGGSIAAGYLF
jgi:hypothetical protein